MIKINSFIIFLAWNVARDERNTYHGWKKIKDFIVQAVSFMFGASRDPRNLDIFAVSRSDGNV